MTKTQGSLVAAKLYESTTTGFPLGIAIHCLFNPFEYTVSKSNSYSPRAENRSDVPHLEFTQAGAKQLQLDLVFDTYAERKDVTSYTDRLWKLMESKTRSIFGDLKKVEPPYVTFAWGAFRFTAVLNNMTQTFTLFLADGTPVRARVRCSFTEFKDMKDFSLLGQNPTSGGGPIERIVQVTAGERLDTIAAEVYGDPGCWRLIAERNGITDPLNLPTGLRLALPEA